MTNQISARRLILHLKETACAKDYVCPSDVREAVCTLGCFIELPDMDKNTNLSLIGVFLLGFDVVLFARC